VNTRHSSRCSARGVSGITRLRPEGSALSDVRGVLSSVSLVAPLRPAAHECDDPRKEESAFTHTSLCCEITDLARPHHAIARSPLQSPALG